MKTRFFIHVLSIFLLAFGTLFLSCSKDGGSSSTTPPTDETGKPITITELSLASSYLIDNSKTFTIGGKGFEKNDVILLKKRNSSQQYIFTIKQLKDNEIVVETKDNIPADTYEIYIQRDNKSKLLGETTITIVFNANIPDKQGMNIKGSVYSQGKGVPNVVVSDGETVTTTDENGIYYLSSNKTNGFVFVSIPSNYEVAVTNSIPQFYKPISSSKEKIDLVDFELIPANNENHVVAFLADMHIANRNDDIAQFRNGFVNDINTLANQVKGQNKKFYAITVGDQTWDLYWYSNNFGLREFKNLIKDFNFPIFHAMGNHDNDPYVANDFLSEKPFRENFGPTYYSFNLGKVHYIVLDNIIYINTGGGLGIIGSRNYNATLTQNQIDWLKADLATITDKSTPIVVVMHIPLHNVPNVNNVYSSRLTNYNAFMSALSGFENVKVVSGHTHYNYRILPNNSTNTNVTEYNIAAICATWWWTGRSGYADNHISKDGSPGGYGVMENSGKDLRFYYKSIGFDKNYQFRAYDLNKVHITADAFAPNANATYKPQVAEYAGEYAVVNDKNQILINVWGYQPNWKITVKENGNNLTVSRVNKKDPLHIISYELKRLNANAAPTSDFVTNNTSHLFLVTASSPTSTIEITVEDEYGNKYQETMTRPKTFNTAMK